MAPKKQLASKIKPALGSAERRMKAWNNNGQTSSTAAPASPSVERMSGKVITVGRRVDLGFFDRQGF